VLRRHVAELPEDLRQAFILNQIHEMPVEDIAAAIGVPAATVRERVLEARARLGAWMEEGEGRGRAEEEGGDEAGEPSPSDTECGTEPQGETESLSSHVREVRRRPTPPRGAAVAMPPGSRVWRAVVACGLAAVVGVTGYTLMHLRHGQRGPHADLPTGTSAEAQAAPTSVQAEPPTSAAAPPAGSSATHAATSVAAAPPVVAAAQAPPVQRPTSPASLVATSHPAITGAAAHAGGPSPAPKGDGPKSPQAPSATPTAAHRVFGTEE
jgi:hypothetical protein